MLFGAYYSALKDGVSVFCAVLSALLGDVARRLLTPCFSVGFSATITLSALAMTIRRNSSSDAQPSPVGVASWYKPVPQRIAQPRRGGILVESHSQRIAQPRRGGILVGSHSQRTAFAFYYRSGLKPNAIRSLLLRPKGRS